MQQVKTKNGKFGEEGAKPSFVSEGKEKERHLHWDNLAAIKGQTKERDCAGVLASLQRNYLINCHCCHHFSYLPTGRRIYRLFQKEAREREKD